MKFSRVKKRSKIIVKVGGTRLEEVDHLFYLDSVIEKDRQCKRILINRIIHAKKAFSENRNLLTSPTYMEIRKQFLKA